MCDYDVDPCSHFSAGAVALYDCNGDLCPEFDQCLDLLNEIEAGTFYDNGWDDYSITDKAGDLCAHSVTTPYKYQQNFYNSDKDQLRDNCLWFTSVIYQHAENRADHFGES